MINILYIFDKTCAFIVVRIKIIIPHEAKLNVKVIFLNKSFDNVIIISSKREKIE